MPALGAGMDEGRVVEWHVAPGAAVQRGDVIALIETDKAEIEVEVFETGVVEELLIEEGTRVPVGTPLARIAAAGAVAAPAPAPPPIAPPVPTPPEAPPGLAPPASTPLVPTPAAPTTAEPHPHVTSPLVRRLAAAYGLDLAAVTPTGPNAVITRHDVERAVTSHRPHDGQRRPGGPPAAAPATGSQPSSPYARRLAGERGVALAALEGTGPHGAVVARDLEAAGAVAAPTPPAAPPALAEPATSPGGPAAPPDRHGAMRAAIARAMARSSREIPHYHLGEHVDVEATLRWLEERNRDVPASRRVLPAALVVRATALACRAYPDLNGSWIDDAFQPADAVNVGVAIALRGGGLLSPAILDADQLTLDEVMSALRDLVTRTRAGRLRGSEATGGTITITNLGDTGVETVHGVIYPPQVALVGVGRIAERAWAADGMVGVRRVLHLTLAADHRASDGHVGGRFLADIATRLRTPEEL
jgi:pyruvate dehydrogenase E2 component (dihydrolipoamide acetyltransferase)